ncbi:hypothetical protein [Cerasicoccus arenae]|nr:hypothetical protein [Cerasicoccus arenae]MBK1859905.1 hypothetical protein [Cerasicoccus arenae]
MKQILIAISLAATLALVGCSDKSDAEKAAKEAKENASSTLDTLSKSVEEGADTVGDKAKELTADVKNWSSEQKAEAIAKFKQSGDALDTQWKMLAVKASSLKGAAKDQWEKAEGQWDDAKDDYSDALDDMKDATAEDWSTVETKLKAAWTSMEAAFKNATAALQSK